MDLIDPYSPCQLDDGTVLQAAVPTWMAGVPSWGSAGGWMARATVLKVYYTDDAGWAERGWTADGMRTVCCDVRVFGRQTRTLYRVPVAQRAMGLFDEDTYIPRGCSQNIEGGIMATEPPMEQGEQPTPAEALDGDQVIVGFMECDIHQPVVLPFCLPHPKSRRETKEADGRTKRMRHNGVLIEWDDEGNLTIDARGAANPELGPSGVEQSASGAAGKLKLVTTDGSDESWVELDNTGKITLVDGGADKIEMDKASKTITLDAQAKLEAKAVSAITVTSPAIGLVGQVALGSSSAASAGIKGTELNAGLTPYLAACVSLAGVNVAQYQALSAACIGPLAPLKAAFEALKTAWQDYGSAAAQLQGAMATWLSTKVKTE
ncbi:MAG: hypothetical protein MUC88_00540 [Planctomycetes bacterium]|jgi:hypothetical protein|nr:hypothetical protein [Planctomycetota bacterium]